MAEYDLSAALARAPINPESFQRVGIEFLTSKLDGDTLVDVNAPAIHLLEASSSMAVYHIQENFALDRRHYRLLAQNYSDLYGHMSDADYLSRFSSPGKVTMRYTVSYDDVIASMVEVPDTNVKRVIIPRYTEVRPGGDYPLTLLYPIEIRQLPHDGLQVVFNTDETTPIQTLTDNVLNWTFLKDSSSNQATYLQIDIPMFQLARNSIIEQISDGNSRFAVPFTDSYYFTRVFQGTTGNWTELKTTHSLQVYDASSPTAILQVGDGVLNITIPPIYYTSGLVSGNLRIDVYTTQGDIYEDLTNFATEKYGITWGSDSDEPSLDDYSSSVPNLPYAWTSAGAITGGTNGLTFEELRERNIYNVSSNKDNSPITPAQIAARLNLLGFDIVKSRDDIVDRLYLATTNMPLPPESLLNAGIAAAMTTFQTTIEKLVLVKGVYDNGDRVTLSPDVLFTLTNGVLSLVDDSLRPETIYRTPETFVNGVNQTNYAFTPFHYVLDTTSNTFSLRPYYLQNPEQTRRRFIRDNATLLIDISTSGFNISRTTTGYRLTIACTAGQSYLGIDPSNRFVQLAFIPAGETAYAYLNGTYMGTTGTSVVWSFDFATDFDLDSDNNLIVNNFSIFEEEPRKLALPLETEFMLLHVVNGEVDEGYQYSAIDGLLGDFLLPDDAKGVTEEFVTLKLGTALDRLWHGARNVAGSYVYQTYTTDVLDYYTTDIPEYDSNGIPVFVIEDGVPVISYAHKAGDQKLDAAGNPIILHKAGDAVLDSGGNPIPISARPVLRLIDLLIFDGNYAFVTQDTDQSDLSWTANNLANTQLDKLEELGGAVLEKTNIYLYPKRGFGPISVIVDDGVEKVIDSSLTFSVKFYLTGTAYRDSDYRTALQTLTAKILNDGIRADTVSVSTLVTLLKPQLDENVVGFDINMYAQGSEMTTFTLSDASIQPTIERVIEYTEDGKYAVKENIEFLFKNHSVTN